jgi:hypothetical protein
MRFPISGIHSTISLAGKMVIALKFASCHIMWWILMIHRGSIHIQLGIEILAFRKCEQSSKSLGINLLICIVLVIKVVSSFFITY